MKKLFYFDFMAMLCCGFVACSDDDDNGGVGNAEDLYGRWTLVKAVWNEDGEQGVDVCEPGEVVFYFDENGTGYEQENYGSQSWTDYFVYELSGNTLFIHFEDDEESNRVKILSLSADKLVICDEGRDEDGYYKYEEHFVRY